MRYERSQSGPAGAHQRLSRRARLLIALATLLAVVVVVIVVNSGSSRYAEVTGTTAQIRATQRVFLEANILVENLGAFTPRSESTSNWLLTSHRVSTDHRGVVGSEFPWISGTGTINAISGVRAHNERTSQERVIASIFGGRARNDAIAEMNQIIDGELASPPRISAPGGAAIVKWLKLHVVGDTAQLEADVSVWEATLDLNGQDGRYRLIRGLNLNQVDAFATLKFSGGTWSVVAFNQAPWQQAT